ncbi:MAG: prepilin-type N-terminal cleavage/methylation domain-containing protein [Bacteroidota bacterium]
MKQISAFTLLELLIGMILSSIVIGFCYTGYSIIHKQYLNYNNIKRENTNAIQLNSILNTDFVNAGYVMYDGDKLILNSENKDQLQYEFKENYILRSTSGLIDSFMFSPVNISPEYLKESTRLPLAIINEFSFDVVILGELEHFHFIKEYSAETMIRLQMENSSN